MRYRVIYLTAGQREAIHLEAPDAAAAVAAVAAVRGRGPATFELLSVVPVPSPATGASAASERTSLRT